MQGEADWLVQAAAFDNLISNDHSVEAGGAEEEEA